MQPQFITTDGGEELVLLSRRDYDAMLARLGDEDAEDRMTERLVAEARERIASGEEVLIHAGPNGRPMTPDVTKPLGERIRNHRKAQNRNQQEFAAAVGITQGYLSEIESGKKHPTGEILQRIAAALDIEIELI